ncbi:MFS transporter [Tabrizicola sp. J26]|nr:MFS transporter [Tabrizicola rongguiensis]
MENDRTISASRMRLPRGIWALGLVSLLMDVSSEMIHGLLPVYLVTVFGAGYAAVGLIEGIAEATALIVKVFSGTLSDWLGRRKGLAVVGYGLAALTKPVFPLAGSLGWVVAARFIDRVGKGIRGAPRDALVADLAPPELRGAAFGLRQSLDTVGAFLGPLLAIGLMALWAGNFRTVFWVAVIPAALSVLVLVVAVKEPRTARPARTARFPLHRAELARLPGAFWRVVAVALVFTLARISEAFLILRACDAGLAIALSPLVLVVLNLVYALTAYPVGILSDRIGREGLLMLGFAVLALSDLVLALDGGLPVIWAGIALWGLHMGLTQGLLATLVADTAPRDLRGTAFGLFNLAGGVAVLVGNFASGLIWQAHGAEATFGLAALVTALGLMGLVWLSRHRPDRKE